MTTTSMLGIETGTVGWYLPSTFDPLHLKDAASTAPFLVVKGQAGSAQIGELRELGIRPPLALDPAQNEASKARKGKTRREGWVERQSALGVDALVSPGAFLSTELTTAEVSKVVRRERDWVSSALPTAAGRRVFAAICVDAHFLRDRAGDLIRQLRGLDCDVWLTLSHQNDPLSLLGTVEALVRVLRACPRVAVMRTDIAGLGSVAFGALMSAIGLSGIVRHSPDGGGGARNDIPVVFVRTLQGFKKTDLLESWVQRDADIGYDLLCPEWCCDGGSILRYADPALAGEALIHNMVSIRAVVDSVLELYGDGRAAKFVSLAKHAWFQHERLSDSIDTIRAEPQLRQWAQLD